MYTLQVYINFCNMNEVTSPVEFITPRLNDIVDMDILQHMVMFEFTSGAGIVIQIIPILSILCLSCIDPNQYIQTKHHIVKDKTKIM